MFHMKRKEFETIHIKSRIGEALYIFMLSVFLKKINRYCCSSKKIKRQIKIESFQQSEFYGQKEQGCWIVNTAYSSMRKPKEETLCFSIYCPDAKHECKYRSQPLL